MSLTKGFFNKTAILIPAFNEDTTIGFVIENLIFNGFRTRQIFIVDDGSTDNTTRIAEALNTTVIKNSTNRGPGYSLQTGMNYIANHTDFKYILTLDADGQHSIKDAKKLINKAAVNPQALLVYGIRDFNKYIPLSKKVSNWLSSLIIQFLYKIKTQDPYCGLRLYRTDIVSQIEFRDRFEWPVDCALIIDKLGERAIPVKIQSIYTDYSMSKGLNLFKGIPLLAKLIKDRYWGEHKPKDIKNYHNYSSVISTNRRN